MDQNIWKILGTFSEAIDSNELAAAVKAQSFDGDYALSEEGITAIEAQAKGLMNVEGAIRNKDVKETLAKELKMLHKKSFLSKFEEDLRPAFEALGIDTTDVEFLSDKAGDIAEKIKALKSAKPTGENKELLASLENDKKELSKQLKEAKEDGERQAIDIRSDFETQDLRREFDKLATKKPWLSAFSDVEDMRDSYLDKKWNKLTAIAKPKRSDGKNVKLFHLDQPDKEYYEGNTKVELQNFIDREFDEVYQKSKPASQHSQTQVPNSTQTDLTPMQRSIRDNARRSEMV
jgi:hypothetical protein